MKNSILLSMISLMSFSIASAQSHRHSSSSKVRVQVNVQAGHQNHHRGSCNVGSSCRICYPQQRQNGHYNQHPSCNHGHGCSQNHCNAPRNGHRPAKPCKPASIRNCPGISCNFQSGHRDCSNGIMDNDRFYGSLNILRSSSFDSDRLILAKNIASNNGLSSWQIREMLMVFSFESSRVEFAKYAYSSCVDPENYYQIQDAFQFSSSISEIF